jgi:prevent-host-death family protein
MREIAQRDLRNDISRVLRDVEAGETLVVTVDRRPVAVLAPLPARRTWRPTADALAELPQADPGLAADLDTLTGATIDGL